MKTFLSFLVAVLLLLGLGWLLYYLIANNPYFSNVEFSLPVALQETEKRVLVTSPLRSISDRGALEVNLTKQGIINYTNIHRQQSGLVKLQENQVLSAMARAKLEDMFQKQYFEHYSPQGEGVENIAENFNYDFIIIGENLALGNFDSDEALVQAWMDSPGHRANILNTGYQEIGIATQKGFFEGREVWVAVQHFGLPSSACPFSNIDLKIEIEDNEQEIKIIQEQLFVLREELQKERQKWGPAYQKKVEEYNALVEAYNNLIESNSLDIGSYNELVRQFNLCVQQFK